MVKVKFEKAFTLIEIIIVITLIVALALIVLIYLRGQIFKGQDARRKSDIQRIGVAAEEYERDHNCYPLPSLMSCNPGTGLRPYIDKIPCDPVNGSSYVYVNQDSICPSWYKLYTKLGNSQDESIINAIGPNAAYNYVAGSANAPSDSSGGSQNQTPGAGTPPPTGGGQITGFYGCQGGVCVPIGWDSSRPGPVCDPNFLNSTCYNQCGAPVYECKPWQ